MITEGDIVRFKKPNPSFASRFCFEKGLTGKVIGEENGYFVIDFGLYYNVYAAEKHLEVVARQSEAPSPGENE